MRKRKPLLHWWSILTDNYGWLWRNNLLYLLCIAPCVSCGFLFLSFHAYIFLLFTAGLFVPAGPAILAIHEIAMSAAAEQHKMIRTKFFEAYRSNGRKGVLLGLFLTILIIIVGLPVYFALSISSPIAGLIVFASCFSLLLWYSCSAQLLSQLILSERINWKIFLRDVFAPGSMSVVFGLLKLIWVIACLLIPVFTLACAFVGVPTLIRFTILFFLYNKGDTDE